MNKNEIPKNYKVKKPYNKPKLISEKVFALDAFGGCRQTSQAQGCGRGPYQSS